jgi:hypothetical protein
MADRQTCYADTLDARAIHHLQSYGQPEPVFDNNIYIITSTFDGRHLHIYTTHPTQPPNPGDPPEYHINQFRAFTITHNPEAFRQGATAYRNARDWAKKKRNKFIETANGKVTSLPQNISFESSGYSEPSTSTNRASTLKSDTSADKLALDHKTTISQRSGKRLKRRGTGENYNEYRSDRRDRLKR